jgi:hypothetical protein
MYATFEQKHIGGARSNLKSLNTLLAATTCGGYKSGYKGREWGYQGPKLRYK